MSQTTQVAPQRSNLAVELLDQDRRKAYLHSRPRKLMNTLARMYRPVLKNRRLVAASAAYALAAGLLPLLGVGVMHTLAGLLAAPGATPRGMLLAAGIYALGFFVLSAASTLLKNRNYTGFASLRIRLLNAALDREMTMDYGLFESPGFMDDVGGWSRALSSNNAGLEGTYHKIFEMGGTLVSALGLGALLALASPWITLAGLAFVAVTYAAQAHVSRYKHARREELSRLLRQMDNLSREAADFRAGKDLRLYDMAGRFRATFAPLLQANRKLYKAFTQREVQLSVPESLALAAIDLAGALLLARGYLSGRITMAQLVMLLTALSLFARTMQELAGQLAAIKDQTRYVDDTMDFIDADLQSRGGTGSVPGTGPVEVIFEDVSFHYPGHDKLVLEHLSLRIPAGQRCALVGVNGAGKTTLVKLLCGLYLPTQGRIFINGVDAATIPQEQLFALFGTVFQEVEPLAFTIAENVAATDRDIDRARVEQSLKTAGLWDKVCSLPRGMDSPMLKVVEEDGVILSGGENQKLMIARALYRQGTRMMVMDEPTAALDALAEQKIYQEFDSLLSGRTALFISHRLASTRFCDRIVLLDGGRITQQGTHEELVAREGLYRRMFLTQGKYYQEEQA